MKTPLKEQTYYFSLAVSNEYQVSFAPAADRPAIVHVHGATWPKNPLYTRHVKRGEFSQFFSEARNN